MPRGKRRHYNDRHSRDRIARKRSGPAGGRAQGRTNGTRGRGSSRLLKKSFASTGKDGVVALSKDSSTSIVPSSSSSADPSPEISSQSGVDHPLPADQLAFYRDAHVDVASSLGARTRL